MEQEDVERIARATLRELGVVGVELKVEPIAGQPGQWRIACKGSTMKIKCGQGSSAQWVRDQIFEQYLAQH